MPMVDMHGKEVINFQLSYTLWVFVSAMLIVLLIGIPLLIILLLVHVIFVLIGAIKADSGELYKYPLTIQFIK